MGWLILEFAGLVYNGVDIIKELINIKKAQEVVNMKMKLLGKILLFVGEVIVFGCNVTEYAKKQNC